MDLEKSLKDGLLSSPPYLPVWFRYDQLGSVLNDECYNNPDYYMHRAQVEVLDTYVEQMVEGLKNLQVHLIDFGCGSCLKSRKFIDALLKLNIPVTFLPIDVSKDFLLEVVKDLETEYQDKIRIIPIAETYEGAIKILEDRFANKAKIMLWFEGMQNEPRELQQKTLLKMSSIMTENCRVCVSADITQKRKDVLAAYNDSKGVNKELAMNSLRRLQKEYNAKFDPDKLQYEVDFVANKQPSQTSYFRAWMRAREDTNICVFGITVELKQGDKLLLYHGEGLSCKYTLDQLECLGNDSRLAKEKFWTDNNCHVAVMCFKRIEK